MDTSDVKKEKPKKKKKNDVVNSQKDGNVKEIPSNPFDFIWDTNNLMPKLENDGDGLGTINEEFSDFRNNRNKSTLGGRVSVILDEQNKTFNLVDKPELIDISTFSSTTLDSTVNNSSLAEATKTKKGVKKKKKDLNSKKASDKETSSPKSKDPIDITQPSLSREDPILIDQFNSSDKGSSNGDSVKFVKKRSTKKSLTEVVGSND